MTLGSVGTDKTTPGSVGTDKMTPGSVGTFDRPFGMIKMTSGLLGTIKTTPESLGTLKTTSGSLGTTKSTPGSLETTKMTLLKLETTGKLIGTDVSSSVSIEGTLDALVSANTVFGTSETFKTSAKATQAMSVTLGTSVGTLATTHISSRSTIRTQRTSTVMVGSTYTSHSPIINHVIMLCGFESNSVFVEYINQQGWSELSHAMSMRVTDVNAVHTVENNGWTFKERPDEKDIQVFKGFLLYHTRMSCTLNRQLDENDVMMVITKSAFDCYLSSEDYHVDMLVSGADRIPSFDEMARAGVFHVESVPPSVLVPYEASKDKVIALDMKVDNGNPQNCLFVESWMVDCVLDDMEEYEVVFEEADTVASRFLSCALNADCSDVNKEVLELETYVSVVCISRWGAKDIKMYNELFVNQWGDNKWEALSGLENGEQLFVAYIQRMLIAVLDSARVFDPGGQDNEMEKVNQNIPVQQ
jgi:hypothetical protein